MTRQTVLSLTETKRDSRSGRESVQFLLRQLANSKRNLNIFNLGSTLIALKFRRAVEKGEASLLVLLFIECCQTVFNKYLRIKYPSINQSVRE